MKYALALIATAVLDLLYAWYTLAVTQRKPFVAGFAAALLYALGGSLIMAYMKDAKVLLFACVGAFIGTAIGTKWCR